MAYEKSIAEYNNINHIVIDWDDYINIESNYLRKDDIIKILNLLIK